MVSLRDFLRQKAIMTQKNYSYTLKTFALGLIFSDSAIQQPLWPLPCIMAVPTKIASQNKHDFRLFIIYEARKGIPFFLFSWENFFWWIKIINKEAKFEIIPIRVVKVAVDDKRTFKYKWPLIHITKYHEKQLIKNWYYE